jgi:glycine dehydrogenase subunit 1
MTALGKQGVKEMAIQNIQKANYAKNACVKAGLDVPFAQPIFNEFVVKLSKPVGEVNKQLLEKGIIGGFDLGKVYPELKNHMLIAVTELRTKEEIDRFVKELGDGNE